MKKIVKSFVLCSAVTLLTACSSGPVNYGEHEGSLLNFAIQKNVFVAYPGSVRPLPQVGVVALDGRIYVTGIATPDGEKITPQRFSVGPKIFETSTQSQYHFLPGKYVVSACFVMDVGNGNVASCRSNVKVLLDIQAGSTTQWALAWPTRNTWNVDQSPPTDVVRGKLVADFNKIMAAADQKPGS